MRKFLFLVGVILLMVLVMAADVPPAGPAAGLGVDSAAVIFMGNLQQPSITPSSDLPR